jgi:hypothetical protein
MCLAWLCDEHIQFNVYWNRFYLRRNPVNCGQSPLNVEVSGMVAWRLIFCTFRQDTWTQKQLHVCGQVYEWFEENVLHMKVKTSDYRMVCPWTTHVYRYYIMMSWEQYNLYILHARVWLRYVTSILLREMSDLNAVQRRIDLFLRPVLLKCCCYSPIFRTTKDEIKVCMYIYMIIFSINDYCYSV